MEATGKGHNQIKLSEKVSVKDPSDRRIICTQSYKIMNPTSSPIMNPWAINWVLGEKVLQSLDSGTQENIEDFKILGQTTQGRWGGLYI